MHYCEKCFRKIVTGNEHQEFCPYFKKASEYFMDFFNNMINKYKNSMPKSSSYLDFLGVLKLHGLRNIRKNKDTKRVNKDELRAMLDDSVWSKDNEKPYYLFKVK